MQARAWAHANPMVVEQITLMTTMSDYRLQFLDLKLRDRLSVADAVALEHRLGLMKAAALSLKWTHGVIHMMKLLHPLLLQVTYNL